MYKIWMFIERLFISVVSAETIEPVAKTLNPNIFERSGISQPLLTKLILGSILLVTLVILIVRGLVSIEGVGEDKNKL